MQILYALTIILSFVTVPVFLKFYWSTKCMQSLTFKMISSTLFVLSGYLVNKISGNNTDYAVLIIWGLVFGWIGDLFLHSLKDKLIHFAIGLVAFLIGHIFYIIAFNEAIFSKYPAAKVFDWYEYLIIGAVAVAVTAFAAVKKLFKTKGPIVAAVIIYAMVLTAMLVKAFKYVIGEIAWGTYNDGELVGIALTVALGSLLFVLSDGSLGVIHASKEIKRGMRIFNIVTYYAAQLLLAASIFFTKSFDVNSVSLGKIVIALIVSLAMFFLIDIVMDKLSSKKKVAQSVAQEKTEE
ncbi:MAG: lysoplasmalogenase [Acutalibacteraceae bacterium]